MSDTSVTKSSSLAQPDCTVEPPTFDEITNGIHKIKSNPVKPVNIDVLVNEVIKSRGCKVSHVDNTEALEFIGKVVKLKQQGKNPNLERTSEILMEQWEIDVPRKSLSDHARGKCSCQRKKT